MKESKFEGLLVYLKTKLTVWMIIGVVNSVSILLLLFLFISTRAPEKTIIVPAEFNQKFWVQGDKVDPVYLEQMATYFANNLLTYNPENAIGQFDNVLRFVEPRVNQELRKKLMADLDDIKSKQRGSVYYITESKAKGKTVMLYGQKLDLMTGSVIGNNMKGYEMKFDYRNGHLFVASFTELPMGMGGISEYEKNQKLSEGAEPAPAPEAGAAQ